MPAPYYTALNQAIVTLLESVENIGVVHNRQRWANNWSTLLDQFQWEPTNGDPRTLRGWMVSRSGIVEETEQSAFGSTRIRTHAFIIRGIMAFSDELSSELVFNNLLDLITETIIEDPNDVLNDSDVVFIRNSGTCSISSIDIRMFGSVLAHYCEVNITIQTEN